MSEECRHSKISSQDFVTCEGCGFKVKDILAALQSSLDTATDEIAALRAKVSEQEWEYASVVNQFHDALKHNTALEKVQTNLATFVRRLAYALRNHDGAAILRHQAHDYLTRNNLAGDPLREDGHLKENGDE